MADIDELAAHFQTLGLPDAAQKWLLDVWHVSQVLDDAADGDKISGDDASKAAWAIFAGMPLNSFYIAYQSVLQPVMVLQLLKWQAANKIEADTGPDDHCYMWRAGFYDLVLMVCHVCGVDGKGDYVLRMYGETYAEYAEGF